MVRPHLIGLPVYKLTGSGNDFVMVDGRVSAPGEWSTEDIRAVCARGTGIGADGLVFVSPGSQRGAARMVYYNADGSHAAMCGNAALCSTTLAVHLSIGAGSEFALETDAGIYRGRVAGTGRAELGLPAVTPPAAVAGLVLGDGERQAALGVVGVPHLVVALESLEALERVDVGRRGRALRFDPALGPQGANVNFVAPAAAGWRMRTYERGIEAETLACGTGAVAAACAIQEWGLGALPLDILTSSGRQLTVRAIKAASGSYEDVWLAGEGRMVMRGVIT
ncbi:MAG: diaminopimelate epimerase [Gemmatimonadales bacterium]